MPNLNILVIRAVQELTGLDEPELITVTLTRRQETPGRLPNKGKVKLSPKAAEQMMTALEKAGWQVSPSLWGGFSWTARPMAQPLIPEYEANRSRAGQTVKELPNAALIL